MPDSAINSLVWATDLDVLPGDRVVTRGDRCWVVRSPRNPRHYWGNFLLLDDAPLPGDGPRWEEMFAREFAPFGMPPHLAFAWDRPDGFEGDARTEFQLRGYQLEHSVGLLAAPEDLRQHARADRGLAFRALAPGGDQDLWDGVLDLWLQTNAEERRIPPADYEPFARRRLAELRELLAGGERGGWFAIVDGGRVVGSLGIVVTGPRARYQAVDTRSTHRRRGIASRLVVEAGSWIAERHPAVERFVIVADPGYHALGIYESLGFRVVERVTGALRAPVTASS